MHFFRKDEGISRKLTPEIRFLLSEPSRMTAAEIHRTLLAKGSIFLGEVSVSTVERFVRLSRKEQNDVQNKDMRRYGQKEPRSWQKIIFLLIHRLWLHL